MHPHLTEDIAAYPTFLIAGVVVGVAVGVWRLRRAGLSWVSCVWLEVVLTVVGLLGAKLYAFWERGGGTLWAVDEWTRSYRYHGGIIAVTLVFILFRRWLLRGLSLGAFADAIAPAAGLALGVVRLGCFAYGCCFGRETHLPWALAFPAHSPVWNSQLAAGGITDSALMSLPVHPLQLYFAVASAAAAVFVWWFDHHKAYAGEAALTFLTLDGLAKLGLETLRGEPMAHLQIAALATALAAGSALLITRMRVRRLRTAVASSALDRGAATAPLSAPYGSPRIERTSSQSR